MSVVYSWRHDTIFIDLVTNSLFTHFLLWPRKSNICYNEKIFIENSSRTGDCIDKTFMRSTAIKFLLRWSGFFFPPDKQNAVFRRVHLCARRFFPSGPSRGIVINLVDVDVSYSVRSFVSGGAVNARRTVRTLAVGCFRRSSGEITFARHAFTAAEVAGSERLRLSSHAVTRDARRSQWRIEEDEEEE